MADGSKETRRRLARLRAENPGYSTAKNRKWQTENPEKRRAHRRVEYALLSGKLIKKPCEVCGAERVEAHHRDYSQPLVVAWLCRTHHIAEHKKNPDP